MGSHSEDVRYIERYRGRIRIFLSITMLFAFIVNILISYGHGIWII